LTGAIAQEELPWVEGSTEGTKGYHIDSTVQQEDKTVCVAEDSRAEEAQSSTLLNIPSLEPRHRALLDATSDDWARGTGPVIKCRLCPDADFSKWEGFKRHCNAMEAHPVEISFCGHCGDFFARNDSLNRHYQKQPLECRNASLVTAETKRRETERVHREFEERLERCLETDEEIGRPFAQIIKEMYPNSAKRGSRQQSRLGRGPEN
jgi:hypothetical protein